MPTRPCLGIVAACEPEAALLRRRLSLTQETISPVGTLWQGRLGGQEIVVLRCGMGETRATRAVTWLVQHVHVWGLISAGFAGGLQRHLATGDAVLVTEVGDHPSHARFDVSRTRVIEPDDTLTHLATVAADRAALVSYAGVLLSSTDLLSQATAKQRLGQCSGALAVDMESYGIGAVAAAQHVPFTVLRTIFDTRDENLPAAAATLMTADGVPQLGRLLYACAHHPWTVTHLPRLWYKARVAGTRLERWLHHFLTLLYRQP